MWDRKVFPTFRCCFLCRSILLNLSSPSRGRGRGLDLKTGITLRRGIQEKEGGYKIGHLQEARGRGGNLWPHRRLQYVTIPPCGLNTELFDGAVTKLSRVGFTHDYDHTCI